MILNNSFNGARHLLIHLLKIKTPSVAVNAAGGVFFISLKYSIERAHVLEPEEGDKRLAGNKDIV